MSAVKRVTEGRNPLQPEYAEVLLLLSGNAICDLRRREISLLYSAAFAGIGICMSVMHGRGPAELLYSVIPGLVLMLFSVITRGDIGFGDGIVVFVMGLFLSWQETATVCGIGLMLSATGAGIWFAIRRRRKDTLPFLPFLLAGYVTAMLL